MYVFWCAYIRVGLYLTIEDYIVSPIPSHGTENLRQVFQSRQAPELPSEWSITDQIPGSDQLSSSRATELSRHSIRGAERATEQTTNKGWIRVMVKVAPPQKKDVWNPMISFGNLVQISCSLLINSFNSDLLKSNWCFTGEKGARYDMVIG